METIFIANVTRSTFFRYEKENESDTGYKKLLLDLLTPQKDNISHWDRKDKIVLAPKKTFKYLERYYNELYM